MKCKNTGRPRIAWYWDGQSILWTLAFLVWNCRSCRSKHRVLFSLASNWHLQGRFHGKSNMSAWEIPWRYALPWGFLHRLYYSTLTRVNSTNVLDEGLRIGGRGHQVNSKVHVSQTRHDYACIENKHGIQLAQSQSVPGRPLLAPIYKWPGLKDPVGFNTNHSVCIWYHLIFWLYLWLGLA
jgi:hypothetical protein